MTERGGSYRKSLLSAALPGLALGVALGLAGCNTTSDQIITGGVPEDVRARHPIAIEEGTHSIVVFVGRGRGGLSPEQRGDVAGLGRSWVHEGTGAIVADVPVDTPNARAAVSAYHEIRSVLLASGVPSNGVVLRNYAPSDPQFFPTIRLSYPKIKATAGPCGLWPEDLGPSVLNPSYNDNKPYYNFGCATQHNMAAMIDNPADLEQPRAETPVYTMRRSEGFDKYRKGQSTTTIYPESEKAKLSDTGQ
ncbi:CpaD family pilus assembly protein [Bradyrhizobium sp. Tv2a-2]|uniref:CpaD family pilus assembly protein n=1 Tax=Bradyrhizobium sp. Tv2a-2 TaxID=113395 RepID=UPI000464E78E|nr:CpaD family pilus assembly protein [Bradyrhizobium sp. Tv2a-2]